MDPGGGSESRPHLLPVHGIDVVDGKDGKQGQRGIQGGLQGRLPTVGTAVGWRVQTGGWGGGGRRGRAEGTGTTDRHAKWGEHLAVLDLSIRAASLSPASSRLDPATAAASCCLPSMNASSSSTSSTYSCSAFFFSAA